MIFYPGRNFTKYCAPGKWHSYHGLCRPVHLRFVTHNTIAICKKHIAPHVWSTAPATKKWTSLRCCAATRNESHLTKTFRKYCSCHTKKIDMWNVTTCHACHTKLHARCFKAFKHDSFCNVSYRHGQIIRIANGCARLRTVAAGKPLPANPKHKREPFATQSGSFGKNHVFSATIWCTWGFIRKFFAGSTACGRGFGRSTASRFHPSANATVWNPGNECPSMVNVIQVFGQRRYC